MTAAKDHAGEARAWAQNAGRNERSGVASELPSSLILYAQNARLDWTMALVSLLRFLDALPEPVVIPTVPQPSDEAKRRGVLVGAVVRDVFGDVGRVVSHGSGGLPLVQWRDAVTRCDTDHLTVIRPAPPSREPNAEAVTRGLYIGARVVWESFRGEIVAWDREGNPIVDGGRSRLDVGPCDAARVTLDGDAS